jgi:hypothetical protein
MSKKDVDRLALSLLSVLLLSFLGILMFTPRNDISSPVIDTTPPWCGPAPSKTEGDHVPR